MKLSLFHEFYIHIEDIYRARETVFVVNILDDIKPNGDLVSESAMDVVSKEIKDEEDKWELDDGVAQDSDPGDDDWVADNNHSPEPEKKKKKPKTARKKKKKTSSDASEFIVTTLESKSSTIQYVLS